MYSNIEKAILAKRPQIPPADISYLSPIEKRIKLIREMALLYSIGLMWFVVLQFVALWYYLTSAVTFALTGKPPMAYSVLDGRLVEVTIDTYVDIKAFNASEYFYNNFFSFKMSASIALSPTLFFWVFSLFFEGLNPYTSIAYLIFIGAGILHSALVALLKNKGLI